MLLFIYFLFYITFFGLILLLFNNILEIFTYFLLEVDILQKIITVFLILMMFVPNFVYADDDLTVNAGSSVAKRKIIALDINPMSSFFIEVSTKKFEEKRRKRKKKDKR